MSEVNENTNNASSGRKLAASAALMGIIILVSKILGLVRDMLTASAFGMTEAGVAYEVASKLPLYIFDFILGGVVTSAFIPIYNSVAIKKSKKEALKFTQSYLNLIILITTSIAVIGIAFAPWLVSLTAPDISSDVAALAVNLTRIMFPMVIFVGIAFSFVGFLQSEGEYNIPALISLVSNLIMVAYLLFLSDKFGVYGLSIAMLVGWGAQAAVQIPSVIKKGFKYELKTPLNTPEIKRAALSTLPILISTWATPVCNLINTRIASGIEEGRAITALGYANRLYLIIVGLFSFVATNLLFPYFAKATASGNYEESDRLTRTSIKTLVFIIAPISAGVGVLSEPFVKLIYEKGVFTSESTAITAEALRFYSVGMVFAAVSEVLTKAFFAAEKMKYPMIASICSIGVNVILVAIFGTKLGIWGIALVASIAIGVNMLINLLMALKQKLISPVAADAVDLLKSILAAAVMGVAVGFLSPVLPLTGIANFAVSVVIGIIVYALAVTILQSDEIKMVFGFLRKRKGKND